MSDRIKHFAGFDRQTCTFREDSVPFVSLGSGSCDRRNKVTVREKNLVFRFNTSRRDNFSIMVFRFSVYYCMFLCSFVILERLLNLCQKFYLKFFVYIQCIRLSYEPVIRNY